MVDVSVRKIAERLRTREPNVLPRAPDTLSAAVAAIVRGAPDSQDAEVLFIRRAESPRDPWSGHMAFPGGRKEPTDADLLATVLRETSEEIGLDLARMASRVGQLDEIEARARGKLTGLIVRPYVFELHPDVQFVPENNYEVAEVLWGRLAPLARGEADTTLRYQGEGYDLTLPAYDVAGRTVWGLTYQMLRALFDRLR
jgi:8-oxo-dGTP pyrophosphatase MutT (NUDIX family)